MLKQAYKSKIYIERSGFLKTIYESECTVCLKKKPNIEIHHNDRNCFNHDLNNLVVLCSNCHHFIHKTSIIFSEVKKRHLIKLERFLSRYF